MANLNDIYIDTIVGQLHTTMSDFLKMKANYILLEGEFQTLVGMNNQQSQMIEEKNAVLTEQIERIKELENDTSTNKTAFTKAIDEMKARCEKAEAEAASLIKKASHIDTFSNQINRMNEEIRRKDSEIGVLNQEIKMLNDMIKELKNPPVPEVQPTKKKAK